MQDVQQTDYAMQSRLVQALMEVMRKVDLQGACGCLRRISRGFCCVGITPTRLKIIALGFLDFSTCKLDVTTAKKKSALTGAWLPLFISMSSLLAECETPLLGVQPAQEYAVRMRRFAASKQMDRLAVKNKILPQQIDSLAANIAHFHGSCRCCAGLAICTAGLFARTRAKF